MKTIGSMSKGILKELNPRVPVMCLYVSTPWGIVHLKQPTMSNDYKCEYCYGIEHYTPLVDPAISAARTWLCANTHCDVYKLLTDAVPAQPTAPPKRSLEWPLFCELNGIGDLYHDVKFENIEQAAAKVSYLLNFSINPQGIIVMRGDPGTGKSYCAMATCEMFTRKSTSAMFLTQKNMADKWLDKIKSNDPLNNFVDKVKTSGLLVIDDFGTAELPPGFMAFFMDVINTRIQWSNRGTIITTNLSPEDMNKFCGEALADRLLTAQIFAFKGKSKRKLTIL